MKKTCWFIVGVLAIGIIGCAEKKSPATVPSLDSKNPQERINAAKDAAKRYGVKNKENEQQTTQNKDMP